MKVYTDMVYKKGTLYKKDGTAIKSNTQKATGFKQCYYNKQKWLVHQLVWFHFHGETSGRSKNSMRIVHVNHDRGDNRIENLRMVPHSTALLLRKDYPMRGIRKFKNGKYQLRLSIDGVPTYIGMYESLAQAQRVKRLWLNGQTLPHLKKEKT